MKNFNLTINELEDENFKIQFEYSKTFDKYPRDSPFFTYFDKIKEFCYLYQIKAWSEYFKESLNKNFINKKITFNNFDFLFQITIGDYQTHYKNLIICNNTNF